MPKSNVDIKPLEEYHIEQMAALELVCFSSPWSADMIREELLNPCAHYWCAEMDGALVGYVGVQVILDEGYITNIAVSPQMRRCGIAKRLLETLIFNMLEQGLAFLTLEVRAGNEPAIALYHQFGFQKVGERPRYYTQPVEDAHLMTKWL